MKQLYLECSSGISGDMTVAALLDAGADENVLRTAMEGLLPGEFSIDIHQVNKNGIRACKFDVILHEEGHHTHECHNHSDEEHHTHECHNHSDEEHHIHEAGHHSHAEYRNLECIDNIIDNADITINARKLAHKIFRIVAQAESKVHGVDINEVHFHEVGATDSIADIVGAAVCIDNIGINDVIVSPLSEGKGQVHCQHGWLSVPVPAVTEIIREQDLSLSLTDTNGEMITPTGAAIAAALRTTDKLPNTFKVERIGIGAGTKDFERPNILRAWIINCDDSKHDGVWVLESNIDDSTGETLGYTMDKLFENGAVDVWYQPIYMKKSRPAYLMGIMCNEDKISVLESIMFENTTTIGIRRHFCERTVLSRSSEIYQTLYGPVEVKVCIVNNKKRIYPEYESVKEIADITKKGYASIYGDILMDINKKVEGEK